MILGNLEWSGYSFLAVILFMLPRIFHKKSRWLNSYFNKNFAVLLETIIIIVFILAFIGGVEYHSNASQYDSFEHVFSTGLIIFILAILFDNYLVNVKRVKSYKVAIGVVFTMLLFLILWELFEWWGDTNYGFIQYIPVDDPNDLIYDFIANAAGITVALAIYYGYKDKIMKQLKR